MATMLNIVIYFGITCAVLSVAVLLVLSITRQSALLFGPVILGAPAVWAMVQWRCKLSSRYACGDILDDGVSWHLWAALTILATGVTLIAGVLSLRQRTGILHELNNLLFASRALAGVWAYVFWASLPIPIIHAPDNGICPNIPLVCHDIPLAGLGGGFWWAGPFFAASALGMGRYVFNAWLVSPSPRWSPK
jgi:hypothetical protein